MIYMDPRLKQLAIKAGAVFFGEGEFECIVTDDVDLINFAGPIVRR